MRAMELQNGTLGSHDGIEDFLHEDINLDSLTVQQLRELHKLCGCHDFDGTSNGLHSQVLTAVQINHREELTITEEVVLAYINQYCSHGQLTYSGTMELSPLLTGANTSPSKFRICVRWDGISEGLPLGFVLLAVEDDSVDDSVHQDTMFECLDQIQTSFKLRYPLVEEETHHLDGNFEMLHYKQFEVAIKEIAVQCMPVKRQGLGQRLLAKLEVLTSQHVDRRDDSTVLPSLSGGLLKQPQTRREEVAAPEHREAIPIEQLSFEVLRHKPIEVLPLSFLFHDTAGAELLLTRVSSTHCELQVSGLGTLCDMHGWFQPGTGEYWAADGHTETATKHGTVIPEQRQGLAAWLTGSWGVPTKPGHLAGCQANLERPDICFTMVAMTPEQQKTVVLAAAQMSSSREGFQLYSKEKQSEVFERMRHFLETIKMEADHSSQVFLVEHAKQQYRACVTCHKDITFLALVDAVKQGGKRSGIMCVQAMAQKLFEWGPELSSEGPSEGPEGPELSSEPRALAEFEPCMQAIGALFSEHGARGLQHLDQVPLPHGGYTSQPPAGSGKLNHEKKAKEQKENEEGKQESLSKAQAAGTSNPAAIDEPSEQATDLDKLAEDALKNASHAQVGGLLAKLGCLC